MFRQAKLVDFAVAPSEDGAGRFPGRAEGLESDEIGEDPHVKIKYEK